MNQTTRQAKYKMKTEILSGNSKTSLTYKITIRGTVIQNGNFTARES